MKKKLMLLGILFFCLALLGCISEVDDTNQNSDTNQFEIWSSTHINGTPHLRKEIMYPGDNVYFFIQTDVQTDWASEVKFIPTFDTGICSLNESKGGSSSMYLGNGQGCVVEFKTNPSLYHYVLDEQKLGYKHTCGYEVIYQYTFDGENWSTETDYIEIVYSLDFEEQFQNCTFYPFD